jgi:hypothetical protein
MRPAEWPIMAGHTLVGYVLALVAIDRVLAALDAAGIGRSVIGFGHTRDFRRYIEPRFRQKL